MARKRKPIAFGKYTLIERVNVGGMAEVFKAIETQACPDGPLLAIKRILPTMAEDDDFITMFLDEAKIASQLENPNVCRIFELGVVDETHFIAMEFIHGKDLLQIQNKFRKQKQIMPVAMAAYVGMRASEGLDYAHRLKKENGDLLGIIHRDISPQNVLVSFQGDVKVIDFGIAKAADRQTKTQAGILKGKFGYMSPEQVLGKKIDHRSDLFALGTVIYEMLTGERLFVGESDFSTLEKVRNVDIHPPRHYNDKIPERLEKIVLKALAKDRDQRYSWGSDLAADLKAWLDSASPYDARKLSQWMNQAFAEDVAKDREKMNEFRALFTGGVAPEIEDEHGEQVKIEPGVGKTEIFDSSAMGLPAIGNVSDADEDAGTEVGETFNPDNAGKTEIFDSAAMPSLQNDPATAATLAPGGLQTPPKPPPKAEGPALLNGAAASSVAAPVSTAPSLEGPVTPPKTNKPRSLMKDVLLGMGLASVLIAGVAVYFLVIQPGADASTPPPQSTSTPVAGVVDVQEPTGATVSIDGKEGCTPTPCQVKDLILGPHKLQLSHPDYETSEQDIKLTSAEPMVIKTTLKAKSPGKIKLISIGKDKFSKLKGSVALYYDSKPLDLSDSGEAELPAGKRTVEIRKQGFTPLSKEIEIPPNGIFELALEAGALTEVMISLTVTSSPKADVVIDGKVKGETPLTIPGLSAARSYMVTVRAEGYDEASKPARWKEGSTDLTIDFGNLSKASAVKPQGFLVANTFPTLNMEIKIDGVKQKQKTPVPDPGIKLTPGKHEIFFIDPKTSQSYGPYEVEITAGATARRSYNLNKPN